MEIRLLEKKVRNFGRVTVIMHELLRPKNFSDALERGEKRKVKFRDKSPPIEICKSGWQPITVDRALSLVSFFLSLCL